MKTLALAILFFLSAPVPVLAVSGGDKNYLPQQWSFDGGFGLFDRAQLRRGHQVYKEVCASCHSMKYMTFRNLGEVGGLEYSVAQVEAIAAGFEITDGPDREGDMFQRLARSADPFPDPYENEPMARAANGGALPPDLSLIIKARFGGADYVHSLLQGYGAAPIGLKLLPGQYYNRYMDGGIIAMVAPLSDGQVEYKDGTKATVAQMAADVAAFLSWASDPHAEARKRIGFQVLVYLSILSILLFFVQKRVWKDAH